MQNNLKYRLILVPAVNGCATRESVRLARISAIMGAILGITPLPLSQTIWDFFARSTGQLPDADCWTAYLLD